MTQCPECRQMILDDSAFCDRCGKELKWCPECKRPKRGIECPVCGSDLIAGRKYLAILESGGSLSQTSGEQPKQVVEQPHLAQPTVQQPQPVVQQPPQPVLQTNSAPQATAVASRAVPTLPTALVGNGWRLTLMEGAFGRVGGMWPELSTCTYVSSSHGSITKSAAGWMITDNGTTNGTFIDEVRIPVATPTVLRKGAKVRIATLEFVVE